MKKAFMLSVFRLFESNDYKVSCTFQVPQSHPAAEFCDLQTTLAFKTLFFLRRQKLLLINSLCGC